MWNHLCLPQTFASSYHAFLDPTEKKSSDELESLKEILCDVLVHQKPENSRFVLECEKSWNELIYYHTIIIQRECWFFNIKWSLDPTSKMTFLDHIKLPGFDKLATRDPRTAWSWCGVVRVFKLFCSSSAVRFWDFKFCLVRRGAVLGIAPHHPVLGPIGSDAWITCWTINFASPEKLFQQEDPSFEFGAMIWLAEPWKTGSRIIWIQRIIFSILVNLTWMKLLIWNH